MQSQLIREKFVQFFIEKSHYHQVACPILSKDDPSLLFVNAGMNPFKELILGNHAITIPRITSVQPCIRVSGKHNDLEAVGIDTYHHTLFEMLGNWSFGDYFKAEAIQWAWELLTTVYQIPVDCIYVTIFAGDSVDGLPKDKEAAQIWAKYLPPERILPFSKKDNFWEMGEQGPCGPCSEIHIDIRSQSEKNAIPATALINKDHSYVIEIWNLVFMQYNRQASGQLVALPHKHIDTGMGFERLAMVLQGKKSSYDTDIFFPLITAIEAISRKKYKDSQAAVAMRVIADHLRAVSFAIADGQLPSNSKAGYVIRRILRRAIRYGYSHLALQEPFIYQLVSPLVAQLGAFYPNIILQQHHIEAVIQAEEKSFLKTLASGLRRLSQCNFNTVGVIPGKTAFELYDTYGFPLDLTRLIAKEQGVTVDEFSFQEALQRQKNCGKKDAATTYSDWQLLNTAAHPHFVGYDQLVVITSIVQWRTITDKYGLGYQVVLEATPFYPEGGGQVADVGCIQSGALSIVVRDVQKEHGLIVHTLSQLPTHPSITASVDAEKRNLIAINHTATHLLQAALKTILGNHIAQKGSLVTPDLLRFDFTHPTKLTAQELQEVESMVNAKIMANIPCLEQRNLPIAQAKAMGAQALFGEKYGTEVRVITFDKNFSIELCGGTHLLSTGQICLFKLISERAIGSGIRRIEAITAATAQAFVANQLAAAAATAALLKQPKDLCQAVVNLIHEKKQLQKQLIVYQTKAIKEVAQQLRQHVEKVAGICLLIQEVQLPHVEALRQISFQYKAIYPKIFVLLATKLEEKAYLTMLLSDGFSQSSSAHDWVQALAPLIGGNGGGTKCFATAGGNKPAGIAAALKAARALFIRENS